jgi:hypothetical protein
MYCISESILDVIKENFFTYLILKIHTSLMDEGSMCIGTHMLEEE